MAKTAGGKKEHATGIPKLDVANKAWTKESLKYFLHMTDGESVKGFALSGL